MKTQNILFLFFLTLIIASLQSCQDDFLELEPRLNELEGNAYQTEVDAFLALVSIYDAQSHQEVLNFQPFRSDIYSDDTYTAGEPPSGGMTTRWQAMETSTITSDNGSSLSIWKRCYAGIYRVHQFLDKESGIAWESEATRTRMIAEAKFLYAYFYYDLVRHFGWVPLVTDVISSEEARSNQQVEPIVIYQYIAENLLQSIANLPETVSANDYGRATKAAGQVLLARIYQYYNGYGKDVLGFTEEWTDGQTVIDEAYVKAELEEIITLGHYSLLGNYADVHDWDNENNEESIFEIQYSEKSLFSDFDRTTEVNGNTTCHIIAPRDPEGDSTIITGWSFGTITWSLYNEFEPGDTRLGITVYNAMDSLTQYTPGYHNTGYFNNKYMGLKAYRSATGSVHNYPKNHIDMRYAEVLLILSELYLDDNNSRATELLNEVRTRSMGDAAALSSVTIEDIYHEKRVEFACEGLRYWDLLRRGLDYAKAKIDESYIPDPSYYAPDEFVGYVFNTAHMGMLPIPADEISNANDGVLSQRIPFYFGF